VQNRKTNLWKIVIQYPYAHASSTATLTSSTAFAALVAAPCFFPFSYKLAYSQH
jgi:hypothetical protein